MATYGTLQPFQPEDEGIAAYLERAAIYFTANDIAAEKQVPVFLSVVGGKIYALLRDLLAPAKPDTKSFTELSDTLKSHFEPKPLVIAERYYFYNHHQKPSESIADYVAELRHFATHCEFGDTLNDALRDRLVCGMRHNGIQQRLLSEAGLTFTKAVDIAQGMEAAEKNARKLKNGDAYTPEPVHRMGGGQGQGKGQQQSKPCYRCGATDHLASTCRFKEATCHNCQKKGHISKVCRSRGSQGKLQSQTGRRKWKETHNIQESTSSHLEEHFGMFHLDEPKPRQPILVNLQVQGKQLSMELDTGAAVSIISSTTKQQLFPAEQLINTNTKLSTYTGEQMAVAGRMEVEVSYGGKESSLTLYVVKGEGPSLLGRDWLIVLKLDWHNIKVASLATSQKGVEALLTKYADVFKEGLGQMNTFEASLHLKPGATPKFLKARSVPFAMKEAIGAELDRLEEAGVIERVNHSKWAAPVVPVPKGDGRLRLCGDYKVTINPALEVDQYPLPKPDDLFASLAGGKRFTKIDLTQAYQQMALDDHSRELVTINTHKGLYRYTRLPFGVASAPAIFQKTMDTVLQDLPKVICYLDDILVTGSTEEEHLANVEKVLERLQKYSIRAKRAKCEFLSPSIEYLGHRVDSTGLHTTQSKVEAIKKAPQPTNVPELRSFLGLVHYYGKFMPNLATLLNPLNLLLKDGAEWVWTEECSRAFKEAKQLLTSAPVLAHYDPALPIKMAGDASAYGIGAVISHVYSDGSERPISFASRTLSPSEQNYSQIEKEALSLIYGIKKFHSYLYGRRFTLVTDHKPLITVLGPKSGIPPMAAARLQRWALLLSAYNYTIEFKPTLQHGNADGLSRLPLGDRQPPSTCSAFVVGQIQALPVTSERLEIVTRQDPILSRVHQYTREGWPSSTPDEFKPYRDRQLELTTQGDEVLWGNRVIIPLKLRSRITEELHRDHPGITRMKALARSYLWWPGLDHNLERCVQECLACQAVRNAPAPAPLHPWLWPTKPWERIHIDFAGPFLGRMFLVVVDAHSKWPEVIQMSTTTSTNTIEALRRLFAAYGLPRQLVSDNGPQFRAEEFAVFCKMNGVKHIHCASYHPASNGLAERFVQTFKRAMKAGAADQQSISHRLSNFLLTYRCTPHATTQEAPCWLFMGRSLRTRLDLLRPSCADRVQSRQSQQKTTHDQHARPRELELGQSVMTRNFRPGSDWVPGVILRKSGPLSYLVKVGDGQVWKRHVDHLRKCGASQETDNREPEDPLIFPSTTNVDAPAHEEDTRDRAESDPPEQPRHNKKSRRYPVRERQAPERFM